MEPAYAKNAIKLERDDILTDESYEILRVWITNGGPSHVWIAANSLDGAYNFGHLMADTIRHGARAYATTFGLDEHDALQQIVNGVGDELREQFETISTIQEGSLN